MTSDIAAPHLSEAKRLLLERRLRGLGAGPAPAGIPRRTEPGPAPLSPAQHGVWLADQLRSDNTLSGVYRVMWLRGHVDTAAFTEAVAALVRRHEILRTTYESTPGGPVQVPREPGEAPLTIAEAPGDTLAERRANALAEAERHAGEAFDLANGPLFTAALTAVADDEHLLVLRMHHLLTDEWSCGLLARELAALYSARRRGTPDGLAELPVQYADYAAWLSEPAQTERRERDTGYWRDALAGVPPVLELPTDRIRPDEPSYRGGVERRTLSPELSAGLRALAAAHKTTMFSALMALFGTVLHRYSGQGRFAVGSLLSGRGRPEAESMMGMFASTVAIPLDFTGSPSFAEALGRAGSSVTGALDHQDATFDQVVAALRLPREPGRNPLFQVIFQCVEASEHEWDFDGLSCEPAWFDTGLAKVDLTLIAVNHPDGVTLDLTYATDLYRPHFAARLLDHLANIAAAAVADPGTRVADAGMLTGPERRDALVEWNATAMEYPTTATVHGLVEEWANREPARPAIWRLDGTAVTFGELNALANKTAHYLRGLGVGRETLVGVCADHSVEMFVALLGVLKAGGAYVPLDVALPRQRAEWILADTAAPIVVTTEALRASIPETFTGRMVTIDGDWPSIEACSDADPEPLSTADNLLYIIYTSGSTGRPKGVLVPHRGVVNYLWWAVEGYGLDGERGAPMLGSIAFDLSVPNFWLPLTGGKCVTLLPTDKSLETLAEALTEPGDFSLLKITPGHLDVMRGMLEPGSVDSVRTFVVGADEVRPETVSGWRAVAPNARIINEYGPTETVVGCSIYTVPPDFDASVSVSIGKPIGNLRMYVLDAGLNPAPVGVVGELYIGGDGVARGYLHRPALTAEKFVPDPYGAPGERLYRTGDLARYRADGDFEFLGRTDFQVKIRGYRIELGEVEARLGLHPGVTEAVAAAVTGRNGHKRLVGYLVAADPDAAPAPAELREFMAAELPEYMVPSVFVTLPAMPLTSAGKVDRTALPDPATARRDAASAERPGTAAETALAAIWAEVLGATAVGPHDNFFELGGDSILAIKVVGKAREAGLALRPTALFKHQTVAELAAAASATATAAPVDAEQGFVTGEVPLTPVQHWFTELDVPRDHYNQAARLRYERAPDEAALRSALTVLVGHHDALRSRLSNEDGTWRQFIAPPGEAELLSVVDLAGVADPAAAAHEAATLAHTSLSLTGGPLLRAVLYRLGDGSAELLIAVHHIAVDTVSWGVLLEDLDALLEGRALPAKTTSVRAWAERLAAYARGPEFDGEADFWARRDAELALVPPIPTDQPLDGNLLGDTAHVASRLPAAETEALLRRLPTAHRAGVDEILLTALAKAALTLWGGTALAVDLEGHGREDLFADVDLTRTVGWFTTVQPVVLRPEGARPGEWVTAVKDHLRAAPRRGIGHGVARHLRGGERPAAGAPQVCFNYLSAIDGSAADALGVERSPAGHRPYLLDVTAYVLDGELWVAWHYGTGCHDEATIEKLAGLFEDAVRELAADGGGGPAAEDFPLAGLARDGFDILDATHDLTGVTDVYRLSPLQAGMLFQTAAQPERGDYVEQFVYTVEGELDPAALREACALAVARHPALRTSFAWRGLPHPVQLVHAPGAPQWTELDWTGVAGGDLAARLESARLAPMSPDTAPPLEFTLIRLGAAEHRLVWRFHHILLDGWSVPIVLDEILTAYRALAAGEPVPAMPEPVAYREHIAWLAGQSGETAGDFWRAAMAGIDGPTPISAVRPENDDDSAEVGIARATWPRDRAEGLVAFARSQRVTPGTVLQAAWALLLAGDSGRADVVFGTTSAGRSAPVEGIDRMVGLLMNTLPARVTVADAPVGDWLRELHMSLGALREHEHVSLSEVRRAAALPAGEPLFDSIFVYENFGAPSTEVAEGLRLDLDSAYEQSGYPLVLGAGLHGDLLLKLNYDVARVGADAAHRLLDSYLGALSRLLEPGAELTAIAPVGRPRRAPAPRREDAGFAPVAYVAPRDETERALAALWADLLDVPRVGVHDDFVALGGDSILAMQVVARARDLGLTLRPRDLVRTPTIAALAAKADRPEAPATVARPSGVDTALVADRFAPGTVESVHRLAPLQTGMLFHVLGDNEGSDYVQVFAFDVDGTPDTDAFAAAWQTVVDRHPALRTVFAWRGLPHPVQVVLRESALDFRDVDLGGPGARDRLLRLIDAEKTTPVDLAAAPATRVTLARTGPGSWSFLWRTHHIVLDGASVPVVLAEVFDAYRALAAGRAAPAAPEPASYGGYLDWIAGHADESTGRHWERVLDGFTTPTPLPAATAASGTGAGLHHLEVGEDLVASLTDTALRHRVTLGSLLHGAWGLLLARHAGTGDVVFGSTVSGRSVPVPGAERIVGMLMNTLPVRVRPSSDGTTGQWLREVHEALADSREHEHSSLVEVQRRSRVPQGRRLFESILVFHNVRHAAGEVPEGVTVIEQDSAIGTAYPLVLDAVWHGGLTLQLNYERERYAPGDVASLVDQYLALLRGLAAGTAESPSALAARVLPYVSPVNAPTTVDTRPAAPAGHVEPAGETERILAVIWADVLGYERVGAADNFFDLGGDSILAIQIVSQAREAGLALTTRHLFAHHTVGELARVVPRSGQAVATGGRAFADSGLDAPELAGLLDGIGGAEVEDVYPLSTMQSGMLFHTLYAPEGGDYHQQYVVDVDGDLDPAALTQAWRHVIGRHAILRSTFAWDGLREPVQIVRRAAEVNLGRIDWSDRHRTDAEFAGWLLAERGRPFDLGAASPQRLDLITLSPGRHRMVWQFHHLLLDGWSTTTVAGEVFAAYGSIVDTGDAPDRGPSPRFGDYVAWQRRQDPESDREYWTGLLAGFDSPTPLPLDRPHAAPGETGALAMAIGEDVTDRLRELGRRERVTVGAILHAAWAMLLSRYAGERDVVFGSTLAGRSADVGGIEDMIGMLMTTLPLRIRVDPAEPLPRFLREVHESYLSVRDHEHGVLTEVQRCAALPADRRLFDSIFVYENLAPAEPRTGGLELSAGPGYAQTGYPLLCAAALSTGIDLSLKYQTGLIGADTARRLLANYAEIVRGIAGAPASVGEVPAMTAAEGELVVGAAAGESTAAPGPTVHALFEEQAALTPGSVAVTAADGSTVTYAELDTASSRLARHLRSLGCGAGTFVGVHLPHSVEVVTTLLAILKAGGVYVPLDPAQPAERLDYMLADTGAAIVVTDAGLSGPPPATFGGTLADLAADAEVIAANPAGRLEAVTDGGDLAYVIYTSGSTGRPKGVLVEHRGLVNYLAWTLGEYGMDGASGAPLVGSIGFDLSITGTFLPLIAGRDITLLPTTDTVEALAALVSRPGDLSLVKTTPSHLDVLRSMLPAGSMRSVRTFVVGGEELKPDAVADFRRIAPGARLVNEYGPTETVVGCSWYVVPEVVDPSVSVLEIGRPIANTSMYVLDTSLRPVPVGAVGELFVGGEQVTRGYLNKPALTADKYVPDPFATRPGARLYRTGDLARLRADGVFEFAGRVDHQVKIRGYRVELGEIEARLLAHPEVRHAAVTVHSGHDGRRELAAHVVGEGTGVDIDALRDHLKAALPDYMVPPAIAVLDSMPLTSNGKIDRKALPAPWTETTPAAGEAPREGAEKLLAAVWAKVLGRGEPARFDDFFDHGGDSIRAIRLISLARRDGLRLTLRDVFERRTVAGLAEAAGVPGAATVPEEREPVTGEVALTPIQHWFTALDMPHDHYNQTALLACAEPVDPALLAQALGALTVHHDALRTRLRRDGDGWHQHVAAPGEAVPVDVTDLSGLSEQDRATAMERAATAANTALDLAAGPLLRAVLFQGGGTDTVLVVAHHLVVDIVSWGILLEDLDTAYRAAADGTEPALPAKTSSYQSWARRLGEYAASERFAPESAYWHGRPMHAAPLPVDHDTGPNCEGSAATVSLALAAQTTSDLLLRASQAYRTGVNDLLLAALARTLRDWTGRDDVRVDLEGHGREDLFDDVDVSRTVGWFTAIRPVEVRLDSGDPGAAVTAVRDRLRAVPHHGIGHGIARHLAPAPGRSRDAGQISFNYHGQDDGETAAGLFTPAAGPTGVMRAPRGLRPYLIEVDAAVIGGELHVEWRYSPRRHTEATVTGLAKAYLTHLRKVVGHCLERLATPGTARAGALLPAGSPTLLVPLARNRVPGVSVATMRGGEPHEVWCHGVTDADGGAPVGPGTLFQAGSISKLVTAAGVLRLVQDGVLDLDTEADRYLRDWRIGAGVTIRRLLTHTAGLTETGYDGYVPGEPVPTLLDSLNGRAPATTPPVRRELEPGARTRYSGAHFTVLQQVITDATATGFAELMHGLVLDPLGMRESGYRPPAADTPSATGHDYSGQSYRGRWRVMPELAAAGLWSTPRDLLRLLAELCGTGPGDASRVLTPDSAALILGRTGEAGESLRIDTGGTPGYQCLVVTDRRTGDGLVVMTNADGGRESLDELSGALLDDFGADTAVTRRS
ncbi:amino acid adenylation domain-containing protein [Phytomonospora sp. NPDC050363]|uniref:amino acid adenylation domain-containing protein n=1 Tax=Phytomonospora sp. NPDC050363 TaxID=3155642 RepID=UPI0033D2CB08